MTYDHETTKRLIERSRTEMTWDAMRADDVAGTTSADYVDGWNDAISARAVPMADQLEAAAAEVARLTTVVEAKQSQIADAVRAYLAIVDATTWTPGIGAALDAMRKLVTP